LVDERNDERRPQEVDATEAQSRALAPPQTEHGTAIRHRRVAGPELGRQEMAAHAHFSVQTAVPVYSATRGALGSVAATLNP
jgi:hypothetical protein